jgi:hypothetical protein
MLHDALKNYLDTVAIIVSKKPEIVTVLQEVIAQQTE